MKGRMTIKYSKYLTINCVKYLYVIINKVNGCVEEFNLNKSLTLVPTNENKEMIKKFEKLWSKIINLISSITKNSDDHNDKFIKIKFNFDEELPLNKTIDISSMIIVIKTVFL